MYTLVKFDLSNETSLFVRLLMSGLISEVLLTCFKYYINVNN